MATAQRSWRSSPQGITSTSRIWIDMTGRPERFGLTRLVRSYLEFPRDGRAWRPLIARCSIARCSASGTGPYGPRLPPSVRDPQPRHIDQPAAGHHGASRRASEPSAHQRRDDFRRDAVGQQQRLGAAFSAIGKQLEGAPAVSRDDALHHAHHAPPSVASVQFMLPPCPP